MSAAPSWLSAPTSLTVLLAAEYAGAGPSSSAEPDVVPNHLLLKLKRRVRRVRFADDVVDNEDLGRKKSKKCCIFHRDRPDDDGSECGDGSGASSADEAGSGEKAAARKRQRTDDADAAPPPS